MRALEAAAGADGVSEAALQEQAGAAVAEEIEARVQPDECAVFLVGHGNNGRDAAIAARLLAGQGRDVRVLLGPRHAVRDGEIGALKKLGARIDRLDDADALRDALGAASLVVDGLVGVGASGPLREPLAAAASLVNEASAERGTALTVLALDIPSGVDPDTGEVPGEAVWADVTVTLGGVKQGLLVFPAAHRVGLLVPRPIAIPSDAEEALPYGLLEAGSLAASLPPRPLDAHKYRFGRALVVAGSEQFVGAPLLCAAAAARAGAGLVTLVCPRSVRTAMASRVPEVTYPPFDLDIEASPEVAVERLEPLLRASDAVVVGPGLGRSEYTIRFLRGLFDRRAHLAPPAASLVVDADGLFALVDWAAWWKRVGPNVVLTPHAGELARLAEGTIHGSTPWRRAGELAARWGCVLVAKGPFTSVASRDGRVDVWPRANPALASGGTGDVLAGLAAGLLAQGATAWDASRVAVAAHALAADAVVHERGWRTLLASDLLDEIPAQLMALAGRNGSRAPRV